MFVCFICLLLSLAFVGQDMYKFVAGKVLFKDAVNSIGTYNISTSELKQM